MTKGTAVLRARNEKRVLSFLRQHQTSTRQDLADALGVSKNTISQIVDQFLKQGVVTETGVDQSGVGRPRIEIQLVNTAFQAIGVLVRDSQLEAMVTDYSGNLLETEVVQVDARDADECLRVLATLTSRKMALYKSALGVGIAVPGMVDPERGYVHTSTHLGWAQVPLSDRLQEAIGNMPVRVMNRVKAAALAPPELISGGVGSVFYVRIDEGVGGALVIQQSVLQGATWTAGEIGHLPVHSEGPLCKCGQRGCLEVMVSLPAVMATLVERIPDYTLRLSAIGALMPFANGAPHPAFDSTLAETGCYLGLALAAVINLMNPAAVVVDSPYGDSLAFQNGVLAAAKERALAHPFQNTHFHFVVLPHSSAMGAAKSVILAYENSLN